MNIKPTASASHTMSSTAAATRSSARIEPLAIQETDGITKPVSTDIAYMI